MTDQNHDEIKQYCENKDSGNSLTDINQYKESSDSRHVNTDIIANKKCYERCSQCRNIISWILIFLFVIIILRACSLLRNPQNNGKIPVNETRYIPDITTQLPSIGGILLTDKEMDSTDIAELAESQTVAIFTPSDSKQSIADALCGSGFIISDDGYVLTCYHLLMDAIQCGQEIYVLFPTGHECKAEVTGYDDVTDIAVLHINATGLSPAVIGSSKDMHIGERFYTMGHPFKTLRFSFSDGMISATERDVQSVTGFLTHMFQFNASIGDGNEGGAVYDETGKVVGMVSMVCMGDKLNGVGFGLPIETVVTTAQNIIAYGYVPEHAVLGIEGEELSEDDAERFAVPIGVYITAVHDETDEDGLYKSDVITKINDYSIFNMTSLKTYLLNFAPGDTVSVTVYRSGHELAIPICLKSMKSK